MQYWNCCQVHPKCDFTCYYYLILDFVTNDTKGKICSENDEYDCLLYEIHWE